MQRQEPEAKVITAEELARLLRENSELKASLQKTSEEKRVLEKRSAELDEEVRKVNSASLYYHSEADKSKASLEKTQQELMQTQEELRSSTEANQALQAQQKQHVAQMLESEQLVSRTALQIQASRKLAERFQTDNANLLAENKELKTQVAEAKQEAAKTPRWKYILGAGLIITGALLTATGVGGAAGIPMAALGYAAFSVGTATLVGSFLYAVYKGIKVCCSSSSAKDDADDDMDLSTTSGNSSDSDSPVHDGQKRTIRPQRSAQNTDDPEEEVKQERRSDRRPPNSSYAGNRYLLNAAPPLPHAPRASTDAGFTQHHAQRRR